jgi:hypothetical protein
MRIQQAVDYFLLSGTAAMLQTAVLVLKYLRKPEKVQAGSAAPETRPKAVFQA